MSNTLAGADKSKTVTFRADEKLVDDFDKVVEESDEWDNRAEALRFLIGDEVDGNEDPEWVMPRDDQLAEAYVTLASEDGHQTHTVDTAVSILSTTSHSQTSKEQIKKTVLPKLVDAGLADMSYGSIGIRQLTPIDEVDEMDITVSPTREVATDGGRR